MAIASTHKRNTLKRGSGKPIAEKGILRALSRKLGLRQHERTGIVLAAAAHLAVAVLLVASPPRERVVLPPERIAVTLGKMVPVATASAPEPTASTAVPPASPDQPSAPLVAVPSPPAETPTKAKGLPEPVSPTLNKPAIPRPDAPPSPRVTATPAARPSPKSSASGRIGPDFLKGLPKSTPSPTAGGASGATSSQAGPAVQSALAAAISRKLKPRWVAPQGVDAEKLVTILSFNLNRDGSLAGTPRMVRQEGITPANRPQAQRHYEQAVRAVQLAAPFTLPSEYYDAWKNIASFRFDKRLSQ